MHSENESNYSFNVFYFVKLVWKSKVKILIASILAGILTFVFTGPKFITPLYKANVIFYPTSNVNLSSSILTEPGTQGFGILEFGNDEDGEQLLQILKSDEMRNNVIMHFNLASHYGMDTTEKVSMLGMRNLLNNNIEIKQTEFKAIEIIVFDSKPELAAEMANYIANYADDQKNEIQKSKSKKALEIVYTEYTRQVRTMDSINAILLHLRNIGIYDYFGQSSDINEALTNNTVRLDQEEAQLKVYEKFKDKLPDTLLIKSRARVEGYRAAIKSLKPSMEQVRVNGGDYINSVNNLEVERKKTMGLKSRYETVKMETENALPQKFVINAADVPEIASTPRRGLSAAIVALSTLIFAILIVFLIDAFPSIRSKLS